MPPRELIERMDNNTLADHLDWLRVEMIKTKVVFEGRSIDDFFKVVAERLRQQALHVVK